VSPPLQDRPARADEQDVTNTSVRHERRGEARLPAVVAVLTAIALYAFLPETLLVLPRLLIPALGVLLLIGAFRHWRTRHDR